MFAQRGERLAFRGVRRLDERLVLRDRIGGEEAAAAGSAGKAELVHPLRNRCTLVLQRKRVTVIVDRAEWLVQFDVCPVRQPLDDAGLDAVLEYRAVTALQSDGPPVRDVVDDRRHDDHADTPDPRRRIQ